MVPRDGAFSVAPSRGTAAAENIVSLESSMLDGAKECSRIVNPGGVWVEDCITGQRRRVWQRAENSEERKGQKLAVVSGGIGFFRGVLSDDPL